MYQYRPRGEGVCHSRCINASGIPSTLAGKPPNLFLGRTLPRSEVRRMVRSRRRPIVTRTKVSPGDSFGSEVYRFLRRQHTSVTMGRAADRVEAVGSFGVGELGAGGVGGTCRAISICYSGRQPTGSTGRLHSRFQGRRKRGQVLLLLSPEWCAWRAGEKTSLGSNALQVETKDKNSCRELYTGRRPF